MSKITSIQIAAIDPNPWQPRKVFDLVKLKGLALSIKKEGLLQPISVRVHPDKPGRYQLIAGECRTRASILAGYNQIKAIIHDVDDEKARRLCLLENMARTDMNVIEEATGVSGLLAQGIPMLDIARTVGRKASVLEEEQYLLKLPIDIQQAVISGGLTKKIGIAIAKLKPDLHFEAYKRVQGRTPEGAMNRIAILAMQAGEQVLFELTQEVKAEMVSLKKTWSCFFKASGVFLTAVQDKEDILVHAISDVGIITNQIDALMKSLRGIRQKVSLVQTMNYLNRQEEAHVNQSSEANKENAR